MTTRVTGYALDGLFRNEIVRSPDFRDWLLGRTKFAGLDAELIDEPWLSRRGDRGDSAPATGIFLVFRQWGLDRRFALHVENRRRGDRLEPGDAARCLVQASRWHTCRQCDDYETLLMAPSALYERHRPEADRYQRYIAYEDVAEFIPEFA